MHGVKNMQQQTVGILEECRCVRVVVLGVSAGYGKSYLFHIVFKFPTAVGNLMFSFDKLIQKINIFLTVKV